MLDYNESFSDQIKRIKNIRSPSKTYKCDKCKDTGWIREYKDGYFYAVMCDCLKEKRENSKMSYAKFPKAYENFSLKDIEIEKYGSKGTEYRREMIEACNIIKKYIDNYEKLKETGIGVYIFSNIKGNGKTEISVGIGNDLIHERDEKVRFISSPDIMSRIKETFSDGSEQAILDELATVPVLIIDDMGTERNTPWVNEKMFQVVNARYLNALPTIFTSNYDIQDLPYGDRVTSRILEKSILVKFPEVSIREKNIIKDISEVVE